MEEHEEMLFDWCGMELGEQPHECLLWHEMEDISEFLVRFRTRVGLISVTTWSSEDDIEMEIEQNMFIQPSDWYPGSIDVEVKDNSFIRITFENKQVDFTASEEPNTLKNILEDWLLSMREDERNRVELNSSEKARRLSSLKREREEIDRKLEHASLKHIEKDIAQIAVTLETCEGELSGDSFILN